MKTYYDTGILLKLYLNEADSPPARQFVVEQGRSLLIHAFHQAEMTSAIQLKVFRKECSRTQASKILEHIESDRRENVLIETTIDWNQAWLKCFELSRSYSRMTGCRTLDSLHLACALVIKSERFITSDVRQIRMAKKIGLNVVNPIG